MCSTKPCLRMICSRGRVYIKKQQGPKDRPLWNTRQKLTWLRELVVDMKTLRSSRQVWCEPLQWNRTAVLPSEQVTHCGQSRQKRHWGQAELKRRYLAFPWSTWNNPTYFYVASYRNSRTSPRTGRWTATDVAEERPFLIDWNSSLKKDDVIFTPLPSPTPSIFSQLLFEVGCILFFIPIVAKPGKLNLVDPWSD